MHFFSRFVGIHCMWLMVPLCASVSCRPLAAQTLAGDAPSVATAGLISALSTLILQIRQVAHLIPPPG